MCESAEDRGGGVAGDLAELKLAVERLELRPPGPRPGAQIRAELVRCRQIIDRLELAFAARVAELAACDEEEWEGHTSPTNWVKEECRTSGHAAWNALVVGEQSARLPESTQALLGDQISYPQLSLIARTAEWMGRPDTEVSVPEARMLSWAREHSVAELRRRCAHLRHRIDPRRFLREQLEQVEARFLELTATEGGGMWLRGYLDGEGGATLRTALEPLAEPAGDEDQRSRERRLADSLVELCGRVLDFGSLPSRSGQRPHLQVTVSLDTLTGAEGSAAAELEGAGAIAAETALRLGCDAAVSRVVFGPQSAVLDMGRATRVPQAATRRAVRARDRGCVWPGCGRPAAWGEVHHLRHWARGGSTDLHNLVTICRGHHWKVHEGGWRLVLADGGYLAVAPVQTGGMPRDQGPDPPEAS